MKSSQTLKSAVLIDTYAYNSQVNAVIETPMGCHAKYKYDEATGLYKLSTVLSAGLVFPHHFGFLPSTRGEDGDPIDVLVVMDAATYPSCLIPSRLIGVLTAEQSESGKRKQRNDRLIAVAGSCPIYGQLKSLEQLGDPILDQLEFFFISYNKMRKREWSPIGRYGPERAEELVRAAQQRYAEDPEGQADK